MGVSDSKPTPGSGLADRGLIWFAFGCIYLIWGSTFLAIRFVVEAFPPFLAIGLRCASAGVVLFALARMRGVGEWPTMAQWRRGALSGGLLFVTGQAVLAWVEKSVDSGVAALILAVIPVWMILLQLHQKRPGFRAVAGVTLGMAGVAILVVPGSGEAVVDPLGGVLLLACGLSWAIGSLVSRSGLPGDSMTATSLQLIAGGGLAMLVGGLLGEVGQLEVSAFTPRPVLAFLYLMVFGSLVTFSAYSWLLTRCEPAAVGSYAFVNPAVAVLLGWAFGGETISAMVLVAAAVIIAGVYLVVTARPTTRHAPGVDVVCLEPAEEATGTS